MKKLTTLLSVILLIAGCSSHPQVEPDEFIIEGCIEGLSDSCIVQLYKPDGQLLKVVAFDTVIDGHFSFRDTISGITQYYFKGRGSQFPGTSVELWTEPGSYTSVTGKGCNFKTWRYDNEVKEQQYVNALLDATRSDWETIGKELIEEEQWFDLLRRNRGNDSISQMTRQKIDSLRQKTDPVKEQIIVKEMDVLNRLPVTPWWLACVERYAPILQYNPDHPVVPSLLKAVARMTDADRQTPSGKVIVSYVHLPEAVEVGDEMVDGDLYDIDGKLHRLAELKGRYILLDFWSSGCGPCVASLPEMEEIIRQYASRLAVVGISDDGEKSWKEFVLKKKLKGYQWNQLGKSNPGLKIAYRVYGIPCYVLISPEGKVLDKWSGYGKNSLKDKIKEIFPE